MSQHPKEPGTSADPDHWKTESTLPETPPLMPLSVSDRPVDPSRPADPDLMHQMFPLQPRESQQHRPVASTSWFGLRPSFVIWVAIGLAFLSSFLPWLRVGGIYGVVPERVLWGLRSDGRMTAGFAALAGVCFGLAKVNSPVMKRPPVIASLIALMPVAYFYLRFYFELDQYRGTHATFVGQLTISFGLGIYMGTFATFVAMGALLVLLVSRPMAAGPVTLPPATPDA